ncbi:MAG: hypothetical protein ACOCY7_02100 [Halodesulfurarchaeum sp.]
MDPIQSLLADSLFVTFCAVFFGCLLGRLEYKDFKFGVSGALFTGLLLGHLGFSVPEGYFLLSLGLFVAAVGLIAAKDIGGVIRSHGLKLLAIGLLMPAVAAVITVAMSTLVGARAIDPHLIEGAFTGALTSSPGLGASLESADVAASRQITIGHSVAYPVGVLLVILLEQLYPRLAKIDIEAHKREFSHAITDGGERTPPVSSEVTFSLAGFSLAVVLGGIVGSIPIPLGPFGATTLGITGGTLIAALAIGYLGEIGPINTRMPVEVLTGIRTLTLAFFLAVVGIQAGDGFVEVIVQTGPTLVGITIAVGLGAILFGLFLARTVWNLNWVIAAGAITGGMTSTPGLGAAIEATGTDEVGAGYGSSYPIALIGMVVFAKIIGIVV